MKPIAAIAIAAALGACASVDILPDRQPEPDATLRAIMAAQPRECPPGRTLENARIGSDNESRGVVGENIMLTPLSSDPSRALRLRRLTVAPGGVIAWHTHDQVQGSALVVSGEMTEIRNTCMDPIRYRAGDVSIEDAQTAHGWRNDGTVEAVIITAHVVARN